MKIESVYQIIVNKDMFDGMDRYIYRIPNTGDTNITIIHVKTNSDKIEHCYAVVTGYPTANDCVFLSIFTDENDKFMKRKFINDKMNPDARITFLRRICNYVQYGTMQYNDGDVDKIADIIYNNSMETFHSAHKLAETIYKEMKKEN